MALRLQVYSIKPRAINLMSTRQIAARTWLHVIGKRVSTFPRVEKRLNSAVAQPTPAPTQPAICLITVETSSHDDRSQAKRWRQ